MLSMTRFLLLALPFGTACSMQAEPIASFTLIGNLPSTVPSSGTTPADVSSDGTIVVGDSSYRFQSGTSGRAFNMPIRWTEAAGFDELIARDSGRSTVATATTAAGDVVIGYDNSPRAILGQFIPFRWTEADGFEELGLPHPFAQLSVVTGVVEGGSTVVGYYRRSGGDLPIYWTESEGYRLIDFPSNFRNPRFNDITPDGSIVAAQANVPDFVFGGSPAQAMRWTEDGGFEQLRDLGPDGGFRSSAANAISHDGSVFVGSGLSADVAGNDSEAFRWTESTGIVGLGDLPGGVYASSATAVSGDGRVVVGTSNTDLGSEGIIWDEINGMRNLREVLLEQGADVNDWIIFDVQGVSFDGSTVVGRAYNVNEPRITGFVASLSIAVPEPTGVVLLLATLAASLRCVRHR